MKISLKWLNDFVDISDYMQDPQKLADLLTRAGLEVEEIQNKAQEFKNVVVGRVAVKDKHPNADKLSLCQVEIAEGKIEQIVCGAQNHKAGDKVIVALPGAVLPGNFAIKKSKIRDVESNGMLCSYKELAMAETSDGIAILDAAAKVGTPFAEFAGLDDVTFELKVTPNRADCLSHYGLAREIGCLIGKPVKQPEVITQFGSTSTKSKIKLNVENSELCPRYCGRYISGVKIGASPEWLKKRLEVLGQNSINNVVDVTNYVMLEMGQPLHAFDADSISQSQITVRQAKAGEKFKTLKEQDLVLKGEELVIADGEKAVALAGVIGGMNSGVSEKTQNIFLESAFFAPQSVRKTSRSHGVETDSAYRFSRGVDQSSAAQIMDRAVLLIKQVAGGEAFSEAYDIYPVPVSKKPITMTIQTVTDRLGYAVDETLFVNYMKGLQFKVEKLADGKYQLTPPVFRFDLEHEMDVVEEYARLHGYENIQESIPALASQPTVHDSHYMQTQAIGQTLRTEGFNQAFNYAFTSEQSESNWLGPVEKLSKLGLTVDANAIKIRNPLSEDLNGMRRTLSYGIWLNTLNNIRSGNDFGSIYEIGSTFSSANSSYKEESHVALVSWGQAVGINSTEVAPVLRLRSAIEKILISSQITAYSFVTQGEAPDFLHKGQWAQVVVEGKVVGFIGTVHPGLCDSEKLRVSVAIAEINLSPVLAARNRPVKFKSLSKFQPVERDFAFVLDSTKELGDLVKEAKKSCGASLRELVVFDIYEGDKLAVGKKSVTFKAIFQSNEAALTEVEINQLAEKLVAAAQKSVGAALR